MNTTWIPDADSVLGFKLLVSDTTAAYTLLETLDSNTELTRYAQDHGYDTIGEILNDNSLRSLNEELQEDYIDANLEIFMNETGITEDDIIRIPGIFEEYPGCGRTTLSLIPGTVNMEVFMRWRTGQTPARPLLPQKYQRPIFARSSRTSKTCCPIPSMLSGSTTGTPTTCGWEKSIAGRHLAHTLIGGPMQTTS